jgi:VanZ family protein
MSLARWLPVAVWAGVILAATSVPNVPASPAAGSDKLAHLAMYAILGLLALRATAVVAPSARTMLLTLAAVALFAAVDEWHQRFIPSRSADPADWIADVAGAALGIASFATLKLRRIKGT